jgi:diadenosine tetraphosphatase ApaH/serine/threonine PP2A family protein phosphatase
MNTGRRLFIGDLHGCLDELNDILALFGFRPGKDRLFSAGDVVGKGPKVPETLARLRDLGAGIVRGNHDNYLLKAAATPESDRKDRQRDYLALLGPRPRELIEFISVWPAYIELPDIILVHGGLEPGKKKLSEMSPRLLMEIRTWDGKGEELDRPGDPAWFECVDPEKTVVFGHWAKRGLIDLPKFKGLDTGCVYGGKLSGWCPEEDRFIQTPARRVYIPIPRGG